MADMSSPAELATELESLEDRFGADIGHILARAQQLELAAAAQGDEAAQERARLIQANMHRRGGDLALSARMCWAVNSWAAERGHRTLLARSHQQLSAIYDNLGDTATGLEHAVLAVGFLDDDSPPRMRAVLLLKLADDLAMDGSVQAFRERYRQAERIALAAGDTEMLLVVLNNFAYADYVAGHAEQAWATMRRLRSASDRAGQRLTPDAVDTLARIQIALGRHTDAVLTAETNVQDHAFSGMDDADALAEYLLTLTVAHRHRGDVADAQRRLDECALLCRERELAGIGVRVLQEQAELHAARGQFDLAFTTYKRFHEASQALVSEQREAQARTRHAMFETAEARRDADRFREQALLDPLTGLGNRRFVDEHLPALLAGAAGAPVTVAMVDLDHFKLVNDTWSHDVGDQVLVQVAGLLRAAAAPGFAARLGGEEFLVVLTGVGAAQAVRRVEELRRAVAAHDWSPLTGDTPVTVSVGMTVADRAVTQPQALATADAALYAAKRGGRNRVEANLRTRPAPR